MTIALCPGSFDPPTNGHVDVFERAARHFDRVIVAVIRNPGKAPLFDAEIRVRLLKESVAHLANVEVIAHDGLTVEVAKEMGAGVILKGLRGPGDVEHELQMAQMNSTLMPEVSTILMPGDPRWAFVSSSLIKEVARYGGDVSEFVPGPVNEALRGVRGGVR
jgi:pantetheine-phosphate adenylyltransferase